MRFLSASRAIGLFAGAILLIAPGAALAGDEVLRGPEPTWVVTAVEGAPNAAAATAEGLRILLFDSQVRADGESEAFYTRFRSMAVSPQALPLMGNVSVTWSPSNQDVTVHHVHIIRDGQIIDVLAGQTFETLRREENLEHAMLDGRITAVLHPAGLRVGDILDVAYTVVSRDPVTGGHFEHSMDLNLPALIDQVRFRASWPTALPVRLRAANDWTPLPVRRGGGQSVVELELNALQPVPVPDDIPTRLRALRLIELTDYRDWSDIAVVLKPLYDRSRRIEPGSSLQAEIERIRALSDDPDVRAAAALRLVQDQVRYVALMMGEGGLTPATAEETWNRRLGDCKGKTVLLLALLDGLGIEAQPAAVSIVNGDGMPDRLPMVSAFDHVLVRAVIGSTVYWLDGTRTGDRKLEDIAVPPFHWALPLTGPEARLEALTLAPLTVPDSETIVAVDASAGLYVPAIVTGTLIMRGDGAAALGGQIGLIPASQKDQGLRSIWSAQLGNPTITEVGSNYDVEANVLTLTMTGTMSLNWGTQGVVPPGATYLPISSLERSEGPFRNAPYSINHPTYSRQFATLRLPEGGRGFRVSGGTVDRTELGHHTLRTMVLEGDLVTVDLSLRSLTDEITAAEADRVRAEELTRRFDPPRVFPDRNYRPSDSDRAAWAAEAPATAGGWLDRAQALSRSGDSAGAAEAAGRAIELDPTSSNAWANRGVYRFWTGDLEGALADLEKAVDIDPSERIAMNGNALLAMNDGRFDDAVIELSRALRQAPGDDFALSTRAQAYLALEQYDRALRDIDTLIAARPTDIPLKLSRIGALEQAGRTEQADAEMDALAEADPSAPGVLLNQAALRLERGKAQEASDILDRFLASSPANPQSALILRGEAAIALGQLDRAAQDFATVREAAPADAEVLNNLCWTAATAGVLLDQALRDCDAALAIAPDSPAILDSRGRLLLQRGDLTGALAAYEAALAIAPELPASLYGRGVARIASGQVEEGERDKAAAIALDPDTPTDFESYPPR
jgi:tetratricopeptide (TPR) repeat protein/transglutaminase-like putative cysteine protease